MNIEVMKTNRMIVVVNELIESAHEEAFSNISHQALFRAYRESEEYSLSWDDIFIGSQANWREIKERLDEYVLLSHLRGGKLELVYFSLYDRVEKYYNSSFKSHLQFYDTSIAMEEMRILGNDFNPYFNFELLRLENKTQLFPLRNELGHLEWPLNRNSLFKTTQPQLRIA